MRTRIREAIKTSEVSEISEVWRTAFADLDAARIGTIHSLCAQILRQHPVEAAGLGIKPGFGVLEEGHAAVLRARAVEDGLAWAAGTRYAGGNSNPGPLTDEGRALVDAMSDYNLMLDISHLWEEAAITVLDRYPGPIVATHGNPRAFVNTPRQLSDDMIRRIAEREGVVGVVAYNRFLDPKWHPGRLRPPLSRLVEAIDHICQITGHAASVGIGSDFDGGFGRDSVPAELDSAADLYKIGDQLRARGYAISDTEAILSGNWLRVMRTVLAAF